jgi:hypothetical protein
MKRCLPNLLTALLLLACIGAATLSVRSYLVSDSVHRGTYEPLAGRAVSWNVATSRGKMWIERSDSVESATAEALPAQLRNPPRLFRWETHPPSERVQPANRFSSSKPWVDKSRWHIRVNLHGLMVVTSVPLVALWIKRLVRKTRLHQAMGLCPHCGYDLRATPGRCPECGTMVDQKADDAQPV